MFHSNGPTDTTELIDVVEPVVYANMNNFVTQEFRANEVHKALKQMHPKKNLQALMVCPLSSISIFGLWLVIVLQILF